MAKMTYYNTTEMVKNVVKNQGKPAVYITNEMQYTDDELAAWELLCHDLVKVYGYHITEQLVNDIEDGGLFFFDTYQAQQEFFNVFGPYSTLIVCETFDPLGNPVSDNV